MTQDAYTAANTIKTYLNNRPAPKLGIICGTGLAGLAEELAQPIEIPYSNLAGFPQLDVLGHEGVLSAGFIGKTSTLILKGRRHLYEGDASHGIKTCVRTLKLLGCSHLVVTNAAGSLDPAMRPGSTMLISDHINMQGLNPLTGPNDDDFGPRFPSLAAAYAPEMQHSIASSARSLAIDLHHGVYLAALGPTFETSAEIRAFRTLGADAVGMSTVAEVIIARHCGLQVAAFSAISNWATGLAKVDHRHEDVLAEAQQAGTDIAKILRYWASHLQ